MKKNIEIAARSQELDSSISILRLGDFYWGHRKILPRRIKHFSQQIFVHQVAFQSYFGHGFACLTALLRDLKSRRAPMYGVRAVAMKIVPVHILLVAFKFAEILSTHFFRKPA
jgi:hypothetical protein